MTTTTMPRRPRDPAKKNSSPERPDKPRLEQRIAEQVIEAMEAGGLPPWHHGWAYDPAAVARNAVTDRPYRGVNILLTELSRMAKGYGDPRWLTYRQAQQMDRQVQKGEKSTAVVLWKFDAPRRPDHLESQINERLDRGEVVVESDTQSPADGGAPQRRRAPLARLYNVFNVEQTSGDGPLPPLCSAPDREPDEAAEAAEAIIAGWPQRPTVRVEHGNLPPRYDHRLDVVLVPQRSRYEDPAEYYTSVFHELVHSTGHASRLARKLGGMDADLHAYGREEMVAGMGAAMLVGRAGFRPGTDAADAVQRDAAYVDHWRRVIEADHAAVIYAAQKAQQACDAILGEVPDKSA